MKIKRYLARDMRAAFRMVREATCEDGELVRGLLVIDLAGASWSSLRHMGLLQSMSKIAVANFPELYEPIFLVNAPSFLAAAWGLFAPFIPAETKKKIAIHSASSTLAALRERIEMQQIPTHLGGSALGGAQWPLPRAAKVKVNSV